MKKFFYTLLFLMLSLMCGCSAPTITSENNTAEDLTSYEDNTDGDLTSYKDNIVETLKDWSFQYNEETNDYSLFFGLLNKNDENISANVDVDIRIVNEENEEVYNATKSVYKSDFGYYTSPAAGIQYLAELKIPAADITSGKSSNGTVYFTVYKNYTLRFNEVYCSALYCLPVADVELIFDALPLNIDVKGFDKSVESTIQINDITYSFEKDYDPRIKIIVSGTKIYEKPDSRSFYDIISYKLYDSEGYVITSGYITLMHLEQGDNFRDDSIVIYDITPGNTYKLILRESDF